MLRCRIGSCNFQLENDAYDAYYDAHRDAYDAYADDAWLKCGCYGCVVESSNP